MWAVVCMSQDGFWYLYGVYADKADAVTDAEAYKRRLNEHTVRVFRAYITA